MVRAMTPQEYAEAWEYNAKQHFDDGDYEWICDKIQQMPWEKPIKRILEVGCGAGYSTLVFILRDFDVISIDANDAAIEKTKLLIEEHDYSPGHDLKLIKSDIVHDFKRIHEELQKSPVDLIVLCNPGGNIATNLTVQEKKWLEWGNFFEEEFCKENLPRLHTYSMIYATCGLAIRTDTPLLLVQRDIHSEIVETLHRIGEDGGVRLINHCIRQIRRPPMSGIPLSDGDSDDVCWGMGLYFPQ